MIRHLFSRAADRFRRDIQSLRNVRVASRADDSHLEMFVEDLESRKMLAVQSFGVMPTSLEAVGDRLYFTHQLELGSSRSELAYVSGSQVVTVDGLHRDARPDLLTKFNGELYFRAGAYSDSNAPVAASDFVTINKNTTAQVNVVRNDGDFDGDLGNGAVRLLTTLPSNQGAVSLAGGTVTFVPADDFVGTVSRIDYQISDLDGNQSLGSLFLRVVDENSSSSANTDEVTIRSDESIAVNVTGNDHDVNASTLRIKSFIASQGTATAAGGVITFTPTADPNIQLENATIRIEYEVDDNDGVTRTGRLNIRVLGPASLGSGLFKASDGNAELVFAFDSPASINSIIPAQSKIYFTSAGDLWETDGSESGEQLIGDPNQSISSFSAVTIGNTLYYTHDDGTHGRELWRTSGGSFEMVADLNPNRGSNPYDLYDFDGDLYFVATTLTGNRLFRIVDGQGNAQEVGGTPTSGVRGIVGDDDTRLYFNEAAFSGFWKTTGTTPSTQEIGDFIASDGVSLNGTLFFNRNAPFLGSELWKTNGTAGGTRLVKDIAPGTTSSFPNDLAVGEDVIFFSARDNSNGQAVWQSDGSESGTQLIADGNSARDSSANITLMTVIGNQVFYRANRATDFSSDYDLFTVVATPPPVSVDIGDRVFVDSNNDGLQTSGEPGKAGVRVRLYDAGANGIIGGGDDMLVGTRTTANDGSYLFSGVDRGAYYVLFDAPDGFAFATPDVGNNLEIDSDARPRASNSRLGDTPVFTVGDATDRLDWDAGLVAAAVVGDFVWLDENENGRLDSGERGVGGVELTLRDENNQFVARTSSAEHGGYSFTVDPGRYRIQIDVPEDYYLTDANVGSDTADSDFNRNTRFTPFFSLASGQTMERMDAGLIEVPNYDTGKLMLVGDFEYDPDNDIFESTGRTFVGLKPILNNDPFKSLISVDGIARYNQSEIFLQGDVSSSIGGVSDFLFTGDTTFAIGATATSVINLYDEPTLQVVGLNVVPDKLELLNPGDAGVADSFIEVEGQINVLTEDFAFLDAGLGVSLTERNPLTIKDTGINVARIALPNAEAEIYGVKLKTTGVTMSLVKDGNVDKFILQGKLEFPNVAGLSVDLLDPNPDDSDPGNRLEITNTPIKGLSADLIGKMTFEKDFLGFSIKNGEIFVDSTTREIKLKGTVLFGPKPVGFDLRQGPIGEVGLRNGEPNTIGFGLAGLTIPIAQTGWELNSIFGSFDNFADSDPDPLAITGELGFSDLAPAFVLPLPEAFGGSVEVNLAKAKLTGVIDVPGLRGTGEVELFKVGFDKSLVKVTGSAALNWEDNFLRLAGGVEVATGLLSAPLLTGSGSLKIDSNLNVFGSLSGAVQIPTSIIPGLIPFELGWTTEVTPTGNALVQYYHNATNADDSISTWATFAGVSYGVKLGFDGSLTWLGARDIRTLMSPTADSSRRAFAPVTSSAFTIGDDSEWMVLGAEWETPRSNVDVVLRDPNGVTIHSDDFDDHDNIRFAPKAWTNQQRVVIIQGSDAGTWEMELVSPQSLGNVNFGGSGSVSPAEVRLTNLDQSVVPEANGSVPIAYDVRSATDDAQVRFYFDADRNGYDGVLVDLRGDNGQPVELQDVVLNADGPGVARWKTNQVPDGEYYVYAVVDDGVGLPQYSEYSAGTVNIGTGATVTGTVFRDRNGNGVREGDEPGLANRQVFLDANSDGVKNADEMFAVTDDQGVYELLGVVPGNYEVRLSPVGNEELIVPLAESYPLTISAAEVEEGLEFAIANHREKADLTVEFRDGTTLMNNYVPGDRLGVLRTSVSNIGNVAANGRTTIETVLSKNNIIGDSDDIVIGTSRRVLRTKPVVDNGRPTYANIVSRIPASVVAGEYYVGVRVDSENVIDELRTFNNTQMLGETINVITRLGRIGNRNVRRLVLDVGGVATTFFATGFLGQYDIELEDGTFHVAARNTNQTSQLRISTFRNAPVTMTGFTAMHTMKGIYARSTDLTGDIDFTRGANRVWLRNVTGPSQLNVGAHDRITSFELRAGVVRDLSIDSMEPIRRVFVEKWIDTDDDDEILAPSFGNNAITSKGRFDAKVRTRR